jgi:hypothetical protein
MKERYKELFSELAGISLIDTHEHIPPENARKFSAMIGSKRTPGYYEKLFDALHVSKCLNFVEYDETELFPGPRLLSVPTVSRIVPRNRLRPPSRFQHPGQKCRRAGP